jgi:hypothetical protein
MKSREDFVSINKGWVHHQRLNYENQEINVADLAFLQKISNPAVMEAAAISVAQQIKDFIEAHRVLLEK